MRRPITWNGRSAKNRPAIRRCQTNGLSLRDETTVMTTSGRLRYTAGASCHIRESYFIPVRGFHPADSVSRTTGRHSFARRNIPLAVGHLRQEQAMPSPHGGQPFEAALFYPPNSCRYHSDTISTFSWTGTAKSSQ